MSRNIKELLELEKRLILEEKKRLSVDDDGGVEHEDEHQENNNVSQPPGAEDKENVLPLNSPSSPLKSQNLPLIERLDLRCNEGALEESKRAFIDKLVNSENPLTFRSDDNSSRSMLRYGEYSPNNPQVRVTAAPYVGLGEYEQRRNFFLQKQRADYLEHLSKVINEFRSHDRHLSNDDHEMFQKSEQLKSVKSSILAESNTKAVQTDIQNIHSRLVQYELQSYSRPEKELSPHFGSSVMQNSRNLPSYRLDQRLTSAQNALLKPEMDKPKSILSNRRTGSPRERLMSDMKHSYAPSFMDGFSFQESRADELERERLKRESYHQDLRLQIEENRRIQQLRDDQERREQELGNRRLEQQLMRMQEEQMIEEQRRTRRDDQMRRHSDDLLRRKQELQGRQSFRKHTDSESSALSLRNTNVASKALSHYSPPVSRRNPYSFNIPSTSVFAEPSTRYNMNRFDSYYRKDALNRMDSLNTYDSHNDSHSRFNAFSRYDSLSRIDSLNRQDTLNRIESLNIQDNLSNVQRRHSATQQDLSMLRKSPKLQRRSSSSRFDDTLPIPVLKAHSPVAKELKNSVPFNSSRHSSDAVRRLEDKWQIPAVQKNIVNHGDPSRDGQGRSILTQLGAIRMQLQQEQLRMDETLRKRDFTQSKAVDFH